MKDQMISNPIETSSIILDCISYPKESLAMGAEGTKAICSALADILWFSDYLFPVQPNSGGMVKMRVTEVNANQHDCASQCSFRVEVEYDHGYTRKEILNTIRRYTHCKFTIREKLQDLVAVEM